MARNIHSKYSRASNYENGETSWTNRDTNQRSKSAVEPNNFSAMLDDGNSSGNRPSVNYGVTTTSSSTRGISATGSNGDILNLSGREIYGGHSQHHHASYVNSSNKSNTDIRSTSGQKILNASRSTSRMSTASSVGSVTDSVISLMEDFRDVYSEKLKKLDSNPGDDLLKVAKVNPYL